MNAEGNGVDNCQGRWTILHPAKRQSCRVGKEVSGNPKNKTGQQINHNESTLILLPGCPKNGVHLW